MSGRAPNQMTLRETLRSWIRLLYYLGQNPVSVIGAALTTSGAITLVAFWFYDFLLPGPPHPYIGILLFLLLPGVFVLGLLLIPIGILLRRHKLKTQGQLLDIYPAINLREPMVRHGILVVGAATFMNVLIFGTASYRGVQYMDSTQFCGQTCHTVMIPEFTAYQNSPHARFNGDKFVVKKTYKDDEKNTPQTTAMLLRIGGHTWQGSVGIHGRHLDEGSRIRYISIDDQRQVIPVVYYTNDQGKTVEYVSSDVQATKQQLAAGEHRSMDCVDCHNRPTHVFETPENAVNEQMASGFVSPELPFMRKK